MKKRTIKPWVLPAMGGLAVLAAMLVLAAAALTSDGSEYFLPFLGYGARVEPVKAKVFGVSAYMLMQIVGAGLGIAAAAKHRELFGVTLKQSVIIMAVFCVQAFIGYKLLYGIESCIQTGKWSLSGAAIYGAFYGMLITVPVLAAIIKIPKRTIADVFSAGGAVTIAVGKLGCFFTGCCGSRLFYIGQHPIYYPVQLAEVFFTLIIAAALFREREKGKTSAASMELLFVMYGSVRFFLEFIRDSSVTRIGLTVAQIHSLVIIIIGAGMWIYAVRKNRCAAVPVKREPLRIKRGAWLIPAVAAIPAAAFAVFLVLQALSSDGSSYPYPFIVYGGAVRPAAVSVLGLALYRFIDAFGATAGVGCAVLLARRFGIHPRKAFAFAVTALLAGFAGGKILYNVEKMYDVGRFCIDLSGQSLFGVLYFALLFTPLAARVYDIKKRTAYDISAIMWLVCLIIARVGCVFSGCCGGKTFVLGTSPVTFPAQLAEITANLIILAVCLCYTDKKRKNGEKYLGAFPIFLMSYSAARFLLEFVRTNPITHLATTEAQKHAVLLFAAGLIMAMRAKPYEMPARKEKRKNKVTV